MTSQMDLVKKYRISIRGHLGQHLLVDSNVQRKIVQTAELEPGDSVLEIGPGLGALTRPIIEMGCRVVAVEKDPRFISVLKKEFKESDLEIYHGDILKIDLDAVLKQAGERKKWKVLGNLPYYITAPILFRLASVRAQIHSAVVTVQKEVGERIVAQPGSKDYGRLTLALQFVADVQKAFDISKTCFIPIPQVQSSVIALRFHQGNCKNETLFYNLIQTGFSQRRKMLLQRLAQSQDIPADKEVLKKIFKQLGLGEKVRAEELVLKQFTALAEAIAEDS